MGARRIKIDGQGYQLKAKHRKKESGDGWEAVHRKSYFFLDRGQKFMWTEV